MLGDSLRLSGACRHRRGPPRGHLATRRPVPGDRAPGAALPRHLPRHRATLLTATIPLSPRGSPPTTTSTPLGSTATPHPAQAAATRGHGARAHPRPRQPHSPGGPGWPVPARPGTIAVLALAQVPHAPGLARAQTPAAELRPAPLPHRIRRTALGLGPSTRASRRRNCPRHRARTDPLNVPCDPESRIHSTRSTNCTIMTRPFPIR